MRSHVNRLSLAFFLSSLSFFGTYFWHKKATENLDRTLGGSTTALIAQVSNVANDVQKNQSSQLMWMKVNTGDQLYDGDSIQTSSRGEVRIQFDDGRYIDLEPDSLIKLEQLQGEIALNLVEGALFVKGNSESSGNENHSPNLVLASASGKVDLSKSSASLTKDKNQSDVNLQILEGKANLLGKDGKTKEIASGQGGKIGSNGVSDEDYNLKVLSPALQKPFYTDPEMSRPIVFKWTGYPKEWKVKLHIGSSRKELKEDTSAVALGHQSVSTKLNVGTHYWKLVALDAKANKILTQSQIFKTEVKIRYAPLVVFPAADALLPMPTFPMDMTFKWQKVDKNSHVILEVSKDQNFSQKIITKTFSEEESFILPNLNVGTYYWRMSAYYEGDDRPHIGKVQKFSLEKIAKTMPKDPVQVAWNLKDQTTQYFVGKPSLELSWTPQNRKDDVALWKLKLTSEGTSPAVTTQYDVKSLSFTTPVAKPGRYIASIEAVDKDGNVIGASEAKTIAVAPLPLLTAPKLLPNNGATILASADGAASISWEAIKGAKEYLLTVQNLTENKIKEFKLQKNQAIFKPQTLSPKNHYQVRVQAIDEHGRKSPEGEYIKLDVPNESNIQAPKLKGIKIKSNE